MIKPEDIKDAAIKTIIEYIIHLEKCIDSEIVKSKISGSTKTLYRIPAEIYNYIPTQDIIELLKKYMEAGWDVQTENNNAFWFIHPEDSDFKKDYTKCDKCSKNLLSLFGFNLYQCVNPRCPNYFFHM